MRIKKVEAWPVRLPRDIDAATGTAGSPTVLTGAGAYRWSSVFPCLYSTNFETALVRVTADNGPSGWGEAQAPLAPEVACEIVRRLLAPAIEGKEFEGTREEIELLWDLMYATMRVRGQTGGFMLDAISGVDIALWDLSGKYRKLPVFQMLDREAGAAPIPVYVSGLPATNRVETAERYLAEGYNQFKLFFDVPSVEEFFRNMDDMPPGARIAVDALWRFDVDNAIAFGEELDDRDALWFEAPLMPEDPQAHAELADEVLTPIAIGESYRTRYELRPFYENDAVEILQPDLGRCGITEGMRIAAEFEDTVVPHISIAMGPQVAAAIHFAAAAANCELAEYNPQVLIVANRFLKQPIALVDHGYAIPEGPGLGIEMREDAL